ncbi:MAG: hypothetical protein GY940_31210 [bacterium]|nr:hypothetical protein [bacterium]
MKKLLSVVMVLGLFMVYACGGGGGSSDAKSILDDFFGAIDTFAGDVEKADTSEAFIASLENLASKMESIAPRMNDLQKKHPNLMKGDTLPEELKEYEERFKNLASKMMGMGMKAQKFGQDPKVQEALKKFTESMNALKMK